jgi:hypothetical protein
MSSYRAPLWDLRQNITSCRNVAVWTLRSYICRSAICSVVTQWSESRRTWNYTLLSHLRLPQPGGPGSHLYISQEQGGQVIPPGTEFPLRCLFRLASNDSQGYGGGILTLPLPVGPVPRIYIYIYISFRNRMIQSKVKATLRPTASQSVCLGA